MRLLSFEVVFGFGPDILFKFIQRHCVHDFSILNTQDEVHIFFKKYFYLWQLYTFATKMYNFDYLPFFYSIYLECKAHILVVFITFMAFPTSHVGLCINHGSCVYHLKTEVKHIFLFFFLHLSYQNLCF